MGIQPRHFHAFFAFVLLFGPQDWAGASQNTETPTFDCIEGGLRRLVLLGNHIRRAGDDFEVLLPMSSQGEASLGYRVIHTSSYQDALSLAQHIQYPIEIEGRVRDAQQAYDALLNRLQDVRAQLATAGQGIEITGRVKSAESLKDKFFENAISYPRNHHPILDILGARMVVESEASLQQVAKQVQQRMGSEIIRVRERDSPSGYHAIHINGRTEVGQYYEIQVLSRRMEALAHWNHDNVYKSHYQSEPAYLARLTRYSRAIAHYFLALDRREPQIPPRPDSHSFGIRAVDEFPWDQYDRDHPQGAQGAETVK